MDKKNPNIYQRALDIVNSRINPDIPQGGSGGSDNVFIVTFILGEVEDNEGIQCDRTIDEITEAFQDKLVVGLVKGQEEDTVVTYYTMVLSCWMPGWAMEFSTCAWGREEISVISLSYDVESSAWGFHTFEYKIERSDDE